MDAFNGETTLGQVMDLQSIPPGTRLTTCYYVTGPEVGDGDDEWWQAAVHPAADAQPFLCSDGAATAELVPRLRGLPEGHRAEARPVMALVCGGWAIVVPKRLPEEPDACEARLAEVAVPCVDGPTLVRLYSLGRVTFPATIPF